MKLGKELTLFSSSDISVMPKKSRPKPSSVRALPCQVARRAISRPAVPAMMAGSAKPSSLNETIWPVTVVPMLAPKTTPMACCSESRPAFTKPTVMTVVALEDWISAVTSVPAKIAATRLRVT